MKRPNLLSILSHDDAVCMWKKEMTAVNHRGNRSVLSKKGT